MSRAISDGAKAEHRDSVAARMLPRTLLVSATLAAALSAAAAARAESHVRLGDKTQWILSVDRLMPLVGYGVRSTTVLAGDTTTRVTESGASFSFFAGHEPSLGAMHTVPRLAADFVVLPRLTVGGSFVLAFGLDGTRAEERTTNGATTYSKRNNAPGSTLLGFAPRAGYLLPITETLFFWPRAGIAFYSLKSAREHTSYEGATSTSAVTNTVLSLDLDPQLVWTPFPHLLVHAGPITNLPLAGTHETSFEQSGESEARSDDVAIFRIGLSVGLGAWFDL